MARATGQRKSQRHRAASGVSQNGAKRDKAAILFADDELRTSPGKRRTAQDVADEIGVSRRTITRWKDDPEFRAMIQDAKGKITADALRLPIAQKLERVRILNDSLMGDLEAKRLRAEHYAALRDDNAGSAMMQDFGFAIPAWAATGKFVAQPKIAANGKTVVEWAYDRALETSINEKLKQAAQELGQWEENVNVNHAMSEYHDDRLDALTIEQLEAIDRILSSEG